MIMTIPIVPTAHAKVTVTDMGNYTEYIGELGGAGFAFLKPKAWNGRLIVACHFFMNEELWTNNPKGGITVDFGEPIPVSEHNLPKINTN